MLKNREKKCFAFIFKCASLASEKCQLTFLALHIYGKKQEKHTDRFGHNFFHLRNQEKLTFSLSHLNKNYTVFCPKYFI